LNIICLDIDDCILPNYNIMSNYVNFDIPIKQLELNLIKLQALCNLENAKIFITSSWSQMLIFWNEFNSFSLKDEDKNKFDQEENQFMNNAYSLLSKYLNGFIIGISSGDRFIDIKKLSSIPDNKIVVFDDWDLDSLSSSNIKIFRVMGSLDNYIVFSAQKFFRA